MNWSEIKNSIIQDLNSRGLSNPNIRLNALDNLEVILKHHFPEYLNNPKENFSKIDKNILKEKIAIFKINKKLNSAESSIINEIYYRIFKMNMMNIDLRKKFGYPTECSKCKTCNCIKNSLQNIDPFYKPSEKNEKIIKILLIGQDPTIFKNQNRVNTVLMLNESQGRNGQLRKWLEKELFGIDNFQKIEIYATNLVKCQFDQPPSTSSKGALNFLKPRFDNCKNYLKNEIKNFKPDFVLTFGESAHILFSKEIELVFGEMNSKMKEDFSGKFVTAKIENVVFNYSPCLHIKTFRVAETYGKQVLDFKKELNERLR